MSLDDIFTLKDVEKVAKQNLPIKTFQFIAGGSLYEDTVEENALAFKKYKIRPKMLKNVGDRDLSTSILGHRIGAPIGLSPSSLHAIPHPDGEVATARGSAAYSVPMTLAMVSSVSLKDVMKACPNAICFQQLIISNPKNVIETFVKKAEQGNAKGLVVTIDYPIFPIKLAEKRSKMDLQTRFDNYGRPSDEDLHALQQKSFHSFMDTFFNGTTTWDDITWLKSITYLPIILKGIQSAEDAKKAVSCGIDAIWVSNHGGRTLDSALATIDVLVEIVTAVDNRCEVYIDSGFRTGLDVFKALALGARVVFVGRPVQYGLAAGGGMGVKKVIAILKNELDNTMALAGCKTLSDITKDHVKCQQTCQCKL